MIIGTRARKVGPGWATSANVDRRKVDTAVHAGSDLLTLSQVHCHTSENVAGAMQTLRAGVALAPISAQGMEKICLHPVRT